jgi:hypothetical protein
VLATLDSLLRGSTGQFVAVPLLRNPVDANIEYALARGRRRSVFE